MPASALDIEVRAQLSRRGFAEYFSAVFGARTPKVSALRQVAQRHPAAVAVFFGDSVGDWEAAKEAGVAFVAVVSDRDSLPGQSVVKLPKFLSSDVVRESIDYVLAVHASGMNF
jgi:phosphoglycolate phosphatase-like HAD superfamily hydrolase